jgi:hypothetical protein
MLSVAVLPVTSALDAVASAIAVSNLAARVLVSAGSPQPFAVRQAPATLRAIATTVAPANLTPLFFVNAGTAQALAITPAPILHRFDQGLRGVADINFYRCGRSARDARETEAGSQDYRTKDCLHAGFTPVSWSPGARQAQH